MNISENTKVSELLKADKRSIEVIANLSKPLEKLRNPILRKLMASRVTLKEAAEMGKVSMDAFAQALQPLGFVFRKEDAGKEEAAATRPGWLQTLPKDEILRLDVRAQLASGSDPLKEIMAEFKKVRPGQALCIINTFVPTPLVRLLGKDGVQTFTEKAGDQEYHTYFFKGEVAPTAATVQPEAGDHQSIVSNLSLEEFEQEKERLGKQRLLETDVRHLEMPGPMQTILSLLETMQKGDGLYVHHKRVPIYLLEELQGKGHRIAIYNQSETEVKLLIQK